MMKQYKKQTRKEKKKREGIFPCVKSTVQSNSTVSSTLPSQIISLFFFFSFSPSNLFIPALVFFCLVTSAAAVTMEISRIPARASMSTHLFPTSRPCCELQLLTRQRKEFVVRALEKNHTSKTHKKLAVPSSIYMVRMGDTSMSSCLNRRPLSEILRDLNKRVPEKTIKPDENNRFFIPWYHANRMLSFYAPGWCGEIRDVTFAENGSVTVVFRITISGSDGEAHRESTGTVLLDNGQFKDPVAAAEEIAFCRACARFGLGLYLYHGEEIP